MNNFVDHMYRTNIQLIQKWWRCEHRSGSFKVDQVRHTLNYIRTSTNFQ